MKKIILLPYDRYQRLLSASESPTEGFKTHAVQPFSKNHVEEKENDTKRSERSEPEDRGNTLASLLPYFSKSIRNQVQSLLTYIQPHVSWNSKGEVILKGTLIPGSNIVDLIKVHMKDYKDFRPVGKDAFGELLIELNVPTSLLAASARHQIGKGSLPPPPGIPVKRKVPEKIVSGKAKWLRL